ncbi:MAG TPA: dihydrodipicolinate synthase family protein [Anaerolineales bacterium]|nr:dihydrodipicolinate synthase family protein [Anaerolineales bacterium]HNN12213.1 dihydrodipicolinate synthase family protein [Anaerolineales bacterium]HNO30828.1 dihydrodipicolinate synthase family protein [Anaerolineales bacterium]
MTDLHPLAGVYAAAVTPYLGKPKTAGKPDTAFDFESLPLFLNFLASRGCHGALLFGTTGEGPSFSPREREALLRSIRVFRNQVRGFKLLAGTGTPSLSETIELTRLAYELGYDGTVVLPPYYFRKASEEGLFQWFSELIENAVPQGKYLLGYHIPVMTGIGFSLDLLERLRSKFPGRFAGIKDSSHDEAFAAAVGQRFGSELLVLNGTDSYFQHALHNHAQGAITAPANLISDRLREVWDLYQAGKDPSQAQAKVTAQRHFLEQYSPIAPVLKGLLHKVHGLPNWALRHPLGSMDEKILSEAAEGFSNL